ncbi:MULTISPECIES: ComEA family DNA-binding protein [Salinivibrio]|uniref:ComEA family DNA-binding protein n=1 Tax=Salinivibrio TaxID=51366 RepID=UPI0009877E2F|nr:MULTISPECIES: ComEA family DNA-binding protein [Salinivibrio]OOF12198.1 hypothetical protein BZG82_01855 [Salinivibrio sp. PR5]OOF12280.1 hypothetical protein BZG83_11545 [Salinivibrio sp. PR919]OOF19507.1 hypothetical protein BZG84_00465 [Salinivibrio sp. PR932]OOF31858.1 hypothetical protein BZJ20_04765 [Salinivibrio proteolyticus]
MKQLLTCLMFALSLVLAPTAWSADESATPAAAQAQTIQVNINTADAKTLAEKLEGVGPSKAAAIIEYRDDHGAFRAPDDLIKVKGIGSATLKKNRDRIKV